MPDGSMFKLAEPAAATEDVIERAKRLRALIVAMHEVLPDHCMTALPPREAETIRIKLLDMAMEESGALIRAADLI